MVYAPTVNILRTPLWGRVFESFGEDPFLTGRLGVAWIKGAQGQGVIANVKHFAANNQEGADQADGCIVGNRFSVDARVDERTLREIYLPQFEAAVKEAHVGSVMCSYNKLNGAHACANRPLLNGILRHDWGFRGFVLADYGGIEDGGHRTGRGTRLRALALRGRRRRREPHAGEGERRAGRRAHHPGGRGPRGPEPDAHAVRLRLLRSRRLRGRRLPRRQGGPPAAARRIEEAGITLLRNRHRALPLDSKRLQSLAIIGSDGDGYKNGGGSSNVRPYSFVSVRQGITARAGSGVQVSYDPGNRPGPGRAGGARGGRRGGGGVRHRRARAWTSRAWPSTAAPPDALARDALIERVAKANPRTIVVLQTGGPVLTPWRNRWRASWRPGTRAQPAARPWPACSSATWTPAVASRPPSRTAPPTCPPPATRAATRA